MTSKQAIDELVECAKFDSNKWELDRLGIIAKDLYLLEIIKKWTLIIKENYKDSYRKFTQFLCIVHTIEMEKDFKKVKEWLENE